MIKYCLLLLVFSLGLGFGNLMARKHIAAADSLAIYGVLKAQEAAWNSGNLEGYMAGYWQSDSLQFIGKKGITRGWYPTLERYRKSYPDAASMGKLSFSELRLEALTDDLVFMTGKWELTFPGKEPAGGYFSLLWSRKESGWRIVADHTS